MDDQHSSSATSSYIAMRNEKPLAKLVLLIRGKMLHRILMNKQLVYTRNILTQTGFLKATNFKKGQCHTFSFMYMTQLLNWNTCYVIYQNSFNFNWHCISCIPIPSIVKVVEGIATVCRILTTQYLPYMETSHL